VREGRDHADAALFFLSCIAFIAAALYWPWLFNAIGVLLAALLAAVPFAAGYSWGSSKPSAATRRVLGLLAAGLVVILAAVWFLLAAGDLWISPGLVYFVTAVAAFYLLFCLGLAIRAYAEDQELKGQPVKLVGALARRSTKLSPSDKAALAGPVMIVFTGAPGIVAVWAIVALAEERFQVAYLHSLLGICHDGSSSFFLVLAALWTGFLQGRFLSRFSTAMTTFAGWVFAGLALGFLYWTVLADYDRYEMFFLDTIWGIPGLLLLGVPVFGTYGWWKGKDYASSRSKTHFVWLGGLTVAAFALIRFNENLLDMLAFVRFLLLH